MLDAVSTKARVCNQLPVQTLHLESTGCFLAEVGDWIGTIIHQMPLRAINIGRIIEPPDLVENVTTFHILVIIVNCFPSYTGLSHKNNGIFKKKKKDAS